MAPQRMGGRDDRYHLHFHQALANDVGGYIGQRADDPECAIPIENRLENGAERFDIETQGNVREA
jgi:hypothetical protein